MQIFRGKLMTFGRCFLWEKISDVMDGAAWVPQ